MNLSVIFDDATLECKEAKPFILFRDHIRPVLETRRHDFEAMYAAVMGRPEIDPVFLAGVTLLQMMERLPDRSAITACRYDMRWRIALDIPLDWRGIDPSCLVYFRRRLVKHKQGKIALEAGLEAMRNAGYLRRHSAVRIDSTHVVAQVSNMSRLECIRETLRLALEFLIVFGGASCWEPWVSRYTDRNPQELRRASAERLRITMDQAGRDAQDILARTRTLGDAIDQSDPVMLLKRVLNEQFESAENGPIMQRKVTPAGNVRNPHDPEAVWSTKGTLGKEGWIGSKLQVCETAPEHKRAPGEPTEAVITAVVTQPATASDHGSVATVLAVHERGGQAKPDEVFADAGYNSAPALEQAIANGYILTGPVGAPPHSAGRFGTDAFQVDIPGRRCTCPAGLLNTECSRINDRTMGRITYYFAWAETSCATCSLKNQCLSQKKLQLFRSLQVGEKHMLVQERRNLCKTKEYQERMHRRSGIEGTHSELTRGYDLRRSRYRGRGKTDVQMQFTAAACNLRRWATRLCWLHHKSKPL